MTNLQDLVYKQGQAGVTKASATIVFNNANKAQSPVGWEQYDKITVTRQVVIGGRNKYLINGHNAPVNKVQNLFHSVQLNVNNPHFLIMQGRITTVLNMKPPEILGLVEEAAGTRMFESKKQATLKIIEKKQRKVDEINRVLAEEITPTLEKLRRERGDYLQWANNQKDVERLKRFCVAWQYTQAHRLLTSSTGEVRKMEEDVAQASKAVRKDTEELSRIKNKVKALIKKRDEEMQGQCEAMEKEVNQLANQLVQETAALQHQRESLQSELQGKSKLEKSEEEASASISGKESELAEARAREEQLNSENKALSKKVQDLQRQHQAAAAGVAVAEGDAESTSFADSISKAKREVTALGTETKQTELKIKHLSGELKAKQKQSGAQQKEIQELQSTLEKTRSKHAALEQQLCSFDFNPEQEQEVLVAKKALEQKHAETEEQISALSAQLSRLEFAYVDPEKGFDRSRVKGLVAKLFRVNDGTTMLALEVTAGGKLWNVVVDTEETAKKILQHNQFKQRITLIPLSKISSREAKPQVVRTAKQLVGEKNVELAKSLVQYDPSVEAAINFVFGNTLVCADLQSAKRVTFHKDVHMRSVTLAGDSFDPAGTLTGGSAAPASSSLLKRIGELTELKLRSESELEELTALKARAEALQATGSKYRNVKREEELARHELTLAEQRVNQTAQHRFIANVQKMEEELREAETRIEELHRASEIAERKVKELEEESKTFADHREEKVKLVQINLNEARRQLKESTKQLKAAQQRSSQLAEELEELRNEVVSLGEQISTAESAIKKMESTISSLSEKVSAHKKQHDEAKAALEETRERLEESSSEIQELVKGRESVAKRITDNELSVKKLQHEITRFHHDQANAKKFVQQYEAKYSWIEAEKQFFGQPNLEYDFEAHDPEKATAQLERLQQKQEQLSKTINRKVLAMWEKAEQEYTELKKKKEIIENDKSKIESAIKELDQKKKEALQVTWQKVNQDFGAIFSTLLPGASSSLQPPDGHSLMEGLEFRVSFGDVTKENLSELSGGQKSLLALSLILALLRFKPAPMYILDEIDAALDLSHTQNIGHMLRTHFKESQFIIISLKEGMFKNANVLFKTKFVDGVSTVTRTALKNDK